MLRRLLVLSIVCAAGCVPARQANVQTLASRAAFDLSCPEGSIEITPIDDRTQGVRGCGQRATYIETCEETGRRRCTWAMDTIAQE
jgi:hypothetical protein